MKPESHNLAPVILKVFDCNYTPAAPNQATIYNDGHSAQCQNR